VASYGEIPKSTFIVGAALWAILAALGMIILTTVLGVKQDQATIIANQSNDRREVADARREVATIRANDAMQDERLAVIETRLTK
jgi:hypothetical protein